MPKAADALARASRKFRPPAGASGAKAPRTPARRRPGRHFQLLHQLHDLSGPRNSSRVGRGHTTQSRLLGLYGAVNALLCLLIFCKLGWLSAVSVFGTYFFMSIIFPTIFALGIFGLGERAKKASSFLVMAIMGGAILPKVMGAIAGKWDLSRGFIVPMVCFGFIAAYAFLWPRLSGAEGLHGVSASGGH